MLWAENVFLKDMAKIQKNGKGKGKGGAGVEPREVPPGSGVRGSPGWAQWGAPVLVMQAQGAVSSGNRNVSTMSPRATASTAGDIHLLPSTADRIGAHLFRPTTDLFYGIKTCF